MKGIGSFLLLMLIFATPALPADLTLFGGAQHAGKIALNNSVSNAVGLLRDSSNAGIVGVRIGHGSLWGGEHTLGYTSNFLDGHSRSVIYNSNLRIQDPTPGVKPYLTAGLGGIFTTGGQSDIGARFAMNYGGGLKLFFAGPVGGSIDVRGYTVPSVHSETLNLVEVSLGAVVRF